MLYPLFNFFAGCALLTYNLTQYRKKKLLLSGASNCAWEHFRSKSGKGSCKLLSNFKFWVIAEIVILSALQFIPGAILNPLFGNLVNTGANYYGLMFVGVPVFVALCILIKVDPLKQMDLVTPAYPLALVFIKIACFFGGCCRGIEWENGFFNPISRRIEFPIQLLESGVALLLFVFLLICKKKFKKGKVFPIYLISYSFLRFFTEFLRVEPEVFMGLKTYQILCLVGVAVGGLEYYLVCKYSDQQNTGTGNVKSIG